MQRPNNVGGVAYKPEFLLDCVLLCDNLREPSSMRDTISRTLKLRKKQKWHEIKFYQIHRWLSLESEWRVNLSWIHWILLSTCFQEHRADFDGATGSGYFAGLWTNEASIFSSAIRYSYHIWHVHDAVCKTVSFQSLCWLCDCARPWIAHLRCDASPQYGRDYLVSQIDYVQFGTSCQDTVITKRLLPIQCVGSRSGGSHQKLEKMLFALTLESESVTWLCWKCQWILAFFILIWFVVW